MLENSLVQPVPFDSQALAFEDASSDCGCRGSGCSCATPTVEASDTPPVSISRTGVEGILGDMPSGGPQQLFEVLWDAAEPYFERYGTGHNTPEQDRIIEKIDEILDEEQGNVVFDSQPDPNFFGGEGMAAAFDVGRPLVKCRLSVSETRCFDDNCTATGGVLCLLRKRWRWPWHWKKFCSCLGPLEVVVIILLLLWLLGPVATAGIVKAAKDALEASGARNPGGGSGGGGGGQRP